MPVEHQVDQTLHDALAVAATRSSSAALEASHELLAHYGDTGDAPTQRAVDTLIVHAADALRALTDSLADISGGLRASGAAAAPFAAAGTRRRLTGESRAPQAHTREHLA
jgi:hypothetical protein